MLAVRVQFNSRPSLILVTSMSFISNPALLRTVLQSSGTQPVMSRPLAVYVVISFRLSATWWRLIGALERRTSRHLTSLNDTATYAFFVAIQLVCTFNSLYIGVEFSV